MNTGNAPFTAPVEPSSKKKTGSKMQSFKNAVAKGSSIFLGDAHFVVKSTADGIANTEAFIVNKLTGQAKRSVVEDRHNKTEETQEKFKAIGKMLSDKLSKLTPENIDASFENDMNSNV